MSGTSTNGSGTPRITGTGVAAAVIAAAAIFAWYRIGSAPAQGDTVNRAPLTTTPDYIHRGAAAFYDLSANSLASSGSISTTSYASSTVYTLTLDCNTTDPVAKIVYSAISPYFNLSVNCMATAYETTLGQQEYYYAFKTVSGTKNGYAIYFPAYSGDSNAAVLYSEPK